MKISFRELSKRITGISTPVLGISWNPPNDQREVAKKLIIFLEDRRALYSPNELEVPEYAIRSILEIRERLTKDLEQLERSSPIAESISAMRSACRKFLDRIQNISVDDRIKLRHGGLGATIFLTAIGELRGVFGIHLAQLCAKYEIDIEADLASILPLSSETKDSITQKEI